MSLKATPSCVSIPPRQTGEAPYYLSATITDWRVAPVERYRTMPTLVELRHAFERHPLIQRDILATLGRGEHTATLVDYRRPSSGSVVPEGYVCVAVIHRPEWIGMDRQSVWQCEGGEVIPVELPPAGWALPDAEGRIYRPDTGLPMVTTPDRERAVAALGEAGTLYFERAQNENGLVGVARLFRWSSNSHPWGLFANAALRPGSPRLGVRYRFTDEEEAERWAKTQRRDNRTDDPAARLSEEILTSMMDEGKI
jgi:hypothetical protein